jgi:hypothetical protein
MTALPNAKSMLSIAINTDTVTRPYTHATDTTQETVSRVSSLNLSSIDDNGELGVSFCSGRFSEKQLPSLFPLVAYRPGLLKEYIATTGRLCLGLVGLEGEALGLGALLALDRKNQLFLGLGRRRVRAETAR